MRFQPSEGMSHSRASGSGHAAPDDDDDDDNSISMRLRGLEMHWGAQARMLGEMRREITELQDGFVRTNTVIHGLQIEVARLDLWKRPLHDVWNWLLHSMRSFPWP